jgi:hypothetical protein
MRELNRFGVTSAIDAGGGFKNYPDDYGVINDLHKRGEMTLRLAYNLFTQKPKQELSDFRQWTQMTKHGAGDDFYRMNGAGEMLVYSAADFEDFLEPRPDMPAVMESELRAVIRHLVENHWPFRLHATYDETITRALNVYEEVNREIPFAGLHWFFDHCETISDRNIERIKALGGGIAIQHRMAFQGEYFVDRYGAKQAERTPPIRRMLELGVPVGAGTDATRVASYNPFVALYWLVTGKTVGRRPPEVQAAGVGASNHVLGDIADDGTIVGEASVGNTSYAVLWTPVPEPIGFIVPAAVFACGLRRRQRPGTHRP